MYDNSTKIILNQKVQLHGNGIKEYWRDVPGYVGYYRVSDWGRIKSLARYVHCVSRSGKSFRNRKPGMIMKPIVGRYPQVKLCKEGERSRRESVHRLVLGAFVGTCPKGKQCRHLDGNPKNNKLENLCWGTVAENMMDIDRHGSRIWGERQHDAKMTVDEVVEARRLFKSGWRICELSRRFNIHWSTLSNLVNRKTWKRVK